MKTLAFVLVIAALSLAALAEAIGFTWSERELFRAEQPAGITYDGFGPYALTVRRERHTLSTAHVVWITRSRESSYGVALNLPADGLDPDRPPAVTWTEEGVELKLQDGDRLFVPRAHFTGGR
jgi:hypothetical protein